MNGFCSFAWVHETKIRATYCIFNRFASKILTIWENERTICGYLRSQLVPSTYLLSWLLPSGSIIAVIGKNASHGRVAGHLGSVRAFGCRHFYAYKSQNVCKTHGCGHWGLNHYWSSWWPQRASGLSTMQLISSNDSADVMLLAES